jgi:hypothetical protein
MDPNNENPCPNCEKMTRVVCYHHKNFMKFPEEIEIVKVTCPSCCGHEHPNLRR